MLLTVKLATLTLLKNLGISKLVADSSWRRKRLLILCYHGVSLDDEHLRRRALYMETAKMDEHLARNSFSEDANCCNMRRNSVKATQREFVPNLRIFSS